MAEIQRPHRHSGVDTRALTRRIRMNCAPNGVIAHDAKGAFDIDALLARARAWPGLEGMDLAKDVSARQTYKWNDGLWSLAELLRQRRQGLLSLLRMRRAWRRDSRSAEHTSALQSLLRISY